MPGGVDLWPVSAVLGVLLSRVIVTDSLECHCARINQIHSLAQYPIRDQSMLTGRAPLPFHRKECWSSRRCTSPTPVSPRLVPLFHCDFTCSVPGSRLSSSGLHPHQSGGPIADPTLYGGPAVSLSPGQPQQLLPPPFYPPPGVMTFPYPTMYPSPQVSFGSAPLRPGCQGLAHVTVVSGSVPGDLWRRDVLRHHAAAGPAQTFTPPPHIPARHRQATAPRGALCF